MEGRVNVTVEPRATFNSARRQFIHLLYFIYARKNYATVEMQP